MSTMIFSDKANLFNTYFHSVYTPSPVGAPNIDSLPSVSNTLSSISIDEADVYYALTSLDPNKAVGLDEIGPRVLRSCAAVLTRPFHHLFLFPSDMQLSLIGGKYTK